MIVGEPTLMGGDFGDEDERLITRLENTQYDAVAAAAANSGVMASHINSGPFPGSGDSPAGIISSPLGLSSGGNMLNSNQPQQQINSLQFRAGPMSSGGSNQSMPHEGVFPGNLTSLQQNQPVSMPPSQSFYSSSAPNRNLHHHSQMMGQQFMPVFTKAQMSASNMLNRGGELLFP